jgi:hypothetical protein
LAVLLLVSTLAAAVAYVGRPFTGVGEAAAAAPQQQDVIRLEGRLGQLERRLYTIESSIRALEQQTRLSDINTGRGARDPEVGVLRSEVEALRLRLAELECGLVRVDERTLTASAREARRKAAPGVGDPCRLNADAPLRLPSRP